MKTEQPADRRAIRELAADASTALDAATAALSDQERRWLEAVPLKRAVAAYDRFNPDRSYEHLPGAARRIEADVRGLAGDAFAQTYAKLLLYAQLASLPERTPPLQIPASHWDAVERSLRALLDVVAGYEAGPWSGESFVKDIAVAQLRVIPMGFYFADAHLVNPRFLVAASLRGEKLAALRYLGPRFFRISLAVGHHAWRGFRDGIRVPMEARFLQIAELMKANPDLQLFAGSGWMNDPKLKAITPHLTEQAEALVALGGRRFRKVTYPPIVEMALTSSATRRKLYEEGKYVPTEYGIVVKRADILGWARSNRQDRAP